MVCRLIYGYPCLIIAQSSNRQPPIPEVFRIEGRARDPNKFSRLGNHIPSAYVNHSLLSPRSGNADPGKDRYSTKELCQRNGFAENEPAQRCRCNGFNEDHQ